MSEKLRRYSIWLISIVFAIAGYMLTSKLLQKLQYFQNNEKKGLRMVLSIVGLLIFFFIGSMVAEMVLPVAV